MSLIQLAADGFIAVKDERVGEKATPASLWQLREASAQVNDSYLVSMVHVYSPVKCVYRSTLVELQGRIRQGVLSVVVLCATVSNGGCSVLNRA
jgi:hypothetical protein